jgi:hypothetical protein
MRRPFIRILLALSLGAGAAFLVNQCSDEGRRPSLEDATESKTLSRGASGERDILEAFEKKISNRWVEASGIVDRLLPDDNEGARHQRFIIRLTSGHSLLVSHNIDLADRLPDLEAGDRVEFRGEYEWNSQGGVVHWTHHDPEGRMKGGWLNYKGRLYE